MTTKVTVEMPAYEGFEYTGEYRQVHKNEWYHNTQVGATQWVLEDHSMNRFFVLKPKHKQKFSYEETTYENASESHEKLPHREEKLFRKLNGSIIGISYPESNAYNGTWVRIVEDAA